MIKSQFRRNASSDVSTALRYTQYFVDTSKWKLFSILLAKDAFFRFIYVSESFFLQFRFVINIPHNLQFLKEYV